MRTGIEFTGSPGDRLRLAALISVQSSPHKHDWRARIVLLSADGTGTSAIWHQRDHVCDGQACDLRLALARAVRGCRCCRLVAREDAPAVSTNAADKTAEVIRLSHATPPPDAAHRTLRALAKAVGLAASTD